MKKIIKKFLSFLGVKIQIPLLKAKNEKKEILKQYKIKTEYALHLLVGSYYYLLNMKKYGINVSVFKENENFIILLIDKFKFKVESVEDIFILSEVFMSKDYNFLTKEKYIFMDIGLNIGVTSLFLISKKNIDYVYSYEPVKYTFDIAKENIEMNSIKNITIKNVGLGNDNRTETFIFNKNYKGNSGVRGDNSYAIKNSSKEDLTEVKVNIIDIKNELLLIRNLHKKVKLGMKIDCEGGEYEILQRMDEEKLFDLLKNVYQVY